MIEIIYSKVLGFIVEHGPAFVLRMFIKPERIMHDVEIDLSVPGPLALYLYPHDAHLKISLRVTNKSPIPVTVDRILYDVWIAQPILDAGRFRRFTAKPKETLSQVFVRLMLNEIQRSSAIAQLDAQKKLKSGMTINLIAYCDSKIGPFEITKSIQINSDNVPVTV